MNCLKIIYKMLRYSLQQSSKNKVGSYNYSKTFRTRFINYYIIEQIKFYKNKEKWINYVQIQLTMMPE